MPEISQPRQLQGEICLLYESTTIKNIWGEGVLGQKGTDLRTY